jgi:hypothetical protein
MISSNGTVPLQVTGKIAIRSWLMLLPPVNLVRLRSPLIIWQMQTALLLLSSLRYPWQQLSGGAGLLYVRYGMQEEIPIYPNPPKQHGYGGSAERLIACFASFAPSAQPV